MQHMISGPNSPKQARPGRSRPAAMSMTAGFKTNLPLSYSKKNPDARLKPKTFPTCCIPGSTQMPAY